MPFYKDKLLETSEIRNSNYQATDKVRMDNSNEKMEFDSCNEFSTTESNNQCVINACTSGNIPIINEYLSSGHKINESLSSGWTLLLYAASYAQPHVIQYLLDFGANPNVHHEGFTPLMALSNTTKALPFQRLECLQYLIKCKVNVDAVSKLRETALMFACKMQELDFVSELVKYTTDINYADSEQKTALFYAVADDRYEIVKLLIDKGADINWMNFRGATVFDIALTKGYDRIIKILDQDEKAEKEEVVADCTVSWFNMFPTMAEINTNTLDSDVASILYGMGLDGYKSKFCGMNLKTLLLLEQQDLLKIGIDISVHRKRFMQDLLRFHKHEWNCNVLKIDESEPFTAFEAIKLLGNLNRQLSVMACGLCFAKTWFNSRKKNSNFTFTNDDQQKYEASTQEIKKIALQIEEAVVKIRHTAVLINQENCHLTLPIYIKKKSKFNCKWATLAVATILAGVYVIKMKSISN